MTFNALAAIVDADKYRDEEVSLPQALEDATPIELAEARSRLSQLAKVARELTRVIDQELAAQLGTRALRYGNSIIRTAGRGRAKVTNSEEWSLLIANALGDLNVTDRAALINALYGSATPRLTAIPLLASAFNGASPQAIKDTFFTYDLPSSPLSVMPLDRAPKFLQGLEEGEIK